MFYYAGDEEEEEVEDDTPDYAVNLFMSSSGYFKKITPQSLRMADQQKLKDGDVMVFAEEASNKTELLFFTDKCQVYKSRASEFKDTKASELGDFVPVKLGFDEYENVSSLIATNDYSGYLIMIFENGKAAKVPLNAYETKTNRKKLANAYSAKSKLVKMFAVTENTDILVRSSNGRAIVFNTGMILPKAARDTIGVQVMTLKSKAVVDNAYIVTEEMLENTEKYFVKNIPAAGLLAKDLIDPDQMKL